MKIQVYDDFQAMSLAAANEIADYLKANPRALLCLPTGDSPKGVYKILAARSDKTELFGHCTIAALDEWVGIERENPGSGTYALEYDCLSALGIDYGRVKFFNSMSKTLEEDCAEMDRFIDNAGGFDIVLLGVGRNGHVGLNEPGAAADSDCHIQLLDEITRNVGQKYFRDNNHPPLIYGITQGLKRMINAKKLMVLASGEVKADIMARAVDGEPVPDVPVGLLRKNPRLQIFFDKAAASKIRS